MPDSCCEMWPKIRPLLSWFQTHSAEESDLLVCPVIGPAVKMPANLFGISPDQGERSPELMSNIGVKPGLQDIEFLQLFLLNFGIGFTSYQRIVKRHSQQ